MLLYEPSNDPAYSRRRCTAWLCLDAAAGIEETAAAAQQASSSMIEVTNSSTELTKLAGELKNLVLHFKV